MAKTINQPLITILMPVFKQASFIRCAIKSLLSQTFKDWELIIIDDGSPDDVYHAVEDYLQLPSIRFIRFSSNKGLGCCLNYGLQHALAHFIAYLPADDIYFANHLEHLWRKQQETNADIVVSGLVYNLSNMGGEGRQLTSKRKIEELPLQLIQVLHRKTTDYWVERDELVTDDLGRMFWDKFKAAHPKVAYTDQITCEWVSHLYQRHKILNDHTGGGIYMYKTYYGVNQALRFHSTVGNFIDEPTRYASFINSPLPEFDKVNGLKILLVGELAYNPERILALENRGHKLYGLWINNPLNYNSVGPFPFGHIETIPFEGWQQRVKKIKPDVIYALLNFKAVDLAHIVLKANFHIPFVWHFKEGPFFCRSLGLWDKLIDLYRLSNGLIYTNSTIQKWFSLFLPPSECPVMVLDGDLPSQQWFTNERSPLLSLKDGEIHTVVAGRMLGIGTDAIEALADSHVHIHIYGDVFQTGARKQLDEALALAPDYVHLHHNCPAESWVREFSQYDAGWLHYFESRNGGDLLRANWIDINSPARMSTYAMAGLPMLMHDNTGHLVHHQQYLQHLNMAIPVKSFSSVAQAFADKQRISAIRKSTWDGRHIFCFDNYADSLIDFFRKVINQTIQ